MEVEEANNLAKKRSALNDEEQTKTGQCKRLKLSEPGISSGQSGIGKHAEVLESGLQAISSDIEGKEDVEEIDNAVLEEDEEGDGDSFANMMKYGLVEQDVGITKFVSTHQGFSGILKERYSDFVVHEINKDGKIVVLDDLSVPANNEEPSEDIFSVLSDQDKQRLEDLQHLKNKEDSVVIE
eukprot:g39631.t1